MGGTAGTSIGGPPWRTPALALLLALLAADAITQQPDTAVTVRVAKEQAVAVPPSVLAGLTPLHELDTAWVAVGSTETVRQLRSAGVALEEVPAAAPGDGYLVVFDPSPDDLAVLRARGQVLVGDGRNWIFVGPEDRARTLVPAHLAFAPLAARAAGPIVLAPAVERATPPGPAATTVVPGPLPASLAAQVSRDRLRQTIADLEGFVTRYASTASGEAAGSYILETFRRLGLEATADYFTPATTPAYTTSNLVATLPGRSDPERIVIVSAHYDSFSDRAETLAPGADDNASGVAAVIETARLLVAQEFDFTVRFIAFGAEERGLLGSQRYAQAARRTGEQIVAVVNLDMLAYADRRPEDLDIVASATSGWLAARLAAAATATASLPTATQVRATFGSDCSPFWQQGFAAVCGIEDVPLANPYYHKTTDRLDTLDLDLATAITRAVVATVADLAQPVQAPAPPAGVAARSQVVRSLFRRARFVSLEWRAGAPGVTGYNVYRAQASHGAYRKLNATPLRERSFGELTDPAEDLFYVVTSVEATGHESNPSGEASVAGDTAPVPQ